MSCILKQASCCGRLMPAHNGHLHATLNAKLRRLTPTAMAMVRNDDGQQFNSLLIYFTTICLAFNYIFYA